VIPLKGNYTDDAIFSCDDIKSGMKTERFEKVDDATWDKVVQRMKDRTRGK
jgi:hypothetical protein